MTDDNKAKELLLDREQPSVGTKIHVISLYLDELSRLKMGDIADIKWCDEAEALYEKADVLLMDQIKHKLQLQKTIAEKQLEMVDKYNSWFIFNRDNKNDKGDTL